MTDFERIVQFQPGYNYLHEAGPQSRGQHGMQIRFALRGPEGATQFLLFTSWTPLGEVDKDKTSENGYHSEPVHCDTWRETNIAPFGATKFGAVPPPMGADVGYHWSKPTYESQINEERECDLLPGGVCWYDGSGLAADKLLREFIDGGDKAVWKVLEDWYNDTKTQADETATKLSSPS